MISCIVISSFYVYNYTMDETKRVDHPKLNLEDRLALVGELEHLRAHALRSAYATKDTDEEFFHLVTASTAQRLRREVENKLGEIDTPDWCELKSAQRIRQLNYETMEGDTELFHELEQLVDSVNTHALEQDMSGCQACKSDRDIVQ